jgi:hypothetical protein
VSSAGAECVSAPTDKASTPLAAMSATVSTVRVGTDELVGEPCGDRGLAQGNDRSRGRLVAAVPYRLRQLVAGDHELLGRQPAQLDDGRV